MNDAKDGQCYQYYVADIFTHIASSQGSQFGTCAMRGYKVEGETYNKEGSYNGHAWMAEVTDFSIGEELQELCDGSDCNQMFQLQELCDGSDCNQMFNLQELYQSQNLVHWVIEDTCYEKAVPANIMNAVLAAPINGLAGGCVVGGFTQSSGAVSANVATFGDVVLDSYIQPMMML